jgi:dihydrofolate reductase/thymidylate synthase
MVFHIIVAYEAERGIGYQNELPWPKSTRDLKYFRKRTLNKTVIMGHNTYLSIGGPLPDRINIVISRQTDLKAVIVVPNLDEALKYAEEVFVIGGAKIFEEALRPPLINNIGSIYVTEFKNRYPNDKKFPEIPEYFFERTVVEDHEELTFVTWTRRSNCEELAYLSLLREIKEQGTLIPSRTGVPCYSVFGRALRFNLRAGVVPLLTTKQVFFRGVVEELLFFISGSTDATILKNKGINIWTGNTSREFLDSHGLSIYDEGDMGPTYSFLFAHAGAEHLYTGKDGNYEGLGVNQIDQLIDGIKREPTGRRHLIVLWAPAHLNKMALPPCLFSYIFNVNIITKEISVMTTMRSADFFLGVPFNICSASLLLRMICLATGYQPGELYATYGDAHIYQNHLSAVTEQLTRIPWRFPTLTFIRSFEEIGSIQDFQYEDFKLNNYYKYPALKAEMAV